MELMKFILPLLVRVSVVSITCCLTSCYIPILTDIGSQQLDAQVKADTDALIAQHNAQEAARTNMSVEEYTSLSNAVNAEYAATGSSTVSLRRMQERISQTMKGKKLSSQNASATTSASPKSQKSEKPNAVNYPVANRVPSNPNMVFSPYNNKPVDISCIPKGTLVADPTFPADQKKFFRVP